MAAFGITAQAQTTVKANRVIATDSIKVGSRWVYLVDADSTFTTVSHRAVPTTKAVRDFVQASAVDTIYVLAGAGDAPDTICISGPHCALLPQSLTTAEIAELISDSLSTIPATDLSFSGLGSPATLESSTGDDVQFAAGAGIEFNVSGGQLSITNTNDVSDLSYDAANHQIDVSNGGTSATIPLALADGATEGLASFTANDFDVTAGNVGIDYTNGQAASGSNKGFLSSADWTTFNNKIGGSGASGRVAYFNGTSTLTSTSNFTYGSDILTIYGSYNSNSTWFQLSPGGGNPIISTATTNNGLIIRTGQGNIDVQRNTDNSSIFMVTRHTSQGYINGAFLVGGTSSYPARLTTRGSGSSSATLSFLAENSSGTDAFMVRDDGNVGIGTTSPANPLHMQGAVAGPYVFFMKNSSAGAGAATNFIFENNVSGRQGQIFKAGTGYVTYKNISANDMGIYNSSNAGNMSFLNDNQSGNINFSAGGSSSAQMTLNSSGGFILPARTGTATALAGWDVNHKSTDVTKGNDLTLTSGTLNVNRDTFPTFDDLLNIYETNDTFTNSRTATIKEDSFLLVQTTNSESGLPYRHYIGTLLDDIDSGDYIFGRYSLTGDIDNYLMDFEGYSYDEGSIIKRLSAYDGSSSSSLTYSASNFQVIVNTVGGICKIRATDAGIAILEGENGIEFKDGPVTSMMTLNTDAARLESSLILVNDAADLAEDGQIWKEENRLNFNTANLSTALSGVMFTGTTDATVANTTTETTLIPSGEGTVTIPANYIKAGKTFTIEAWGIYTADASPSTLEIKATLGGVLLCTTGANTMTTSEGGQWHTTITFTCRTTGATGTVMSQGETRFNHAVGAGTTYWMRRSATNTVNTTGSLAFNLTGQHGAADPDNSITLTNIKITVEN